ncbi:S-adenosylmethionine carrier 1, chloroplastic/mitochondrial-like protein [Drosera capensis]
MGPITLAIEGKKSSPMVSSSDGSLMTPPGHQSGTRKRFASVNLGEKKPFDFFHSILDGIIAGGAAGVAARGGGQIVLKGLYSGLVGNLIGVLPASATFVGVYEPTKQKLLKLLPENLSAVAHFTAGAVGGVAASLIRVPTEVVKQRMQTGQFSSAPDAVRLILSNEGFRGLYAGYGSFLLRDLPFDAIQFCIYEQLRMGYKLAAKRELNDPENAVIGAFAGALTGAVTTPLDVIKTRLMVQGSQNQYKGIVDCVNTIIRDEGAPALLKGIGPRVMWIGIGGSIFFSVLESTKRILAQKRHRKQDQVINGKED